jgi:chromosome segregation protein
VAQVQQQIQVQAVQRRAADERGRNLQQRRGKLTLDANALAMVDPSRLADAQAHAQELAVESARLQDQLHSVQTQVPLLDTARQEAQTASNAEQAKLAGLKARLEALHTLQERVKVDGKLKPWLAKHGLDSMQGLWSRIHVEPGWENALESALRERLGALEVSRLDMVRGFLGSQGHDAPPAKLAFFNPPQAAAPVGGAVAAHGLKPLADLLRLSDAGQRAVLHDWLRHAYTASSMDEALQKRTLLQAGETIYLQSGHAVSAHSLSFYAQDSEQAGLLARAQEMENLDKQLRAQSLIADEARSALQRAESLCAESSQRLMQLRRDASSAQERAHQASMEQMRLTQMAEQTRLRHEQISGDLAEVDDQLQELQTQLVELDQNFEQLDMQLADTQERQAQLDDEVAAADQALHQAREGLRQIEREEQEARFAVRNLEARLQEQSRTIETATQQAQSLMAETAQANDELVRLTDVAAQAGLQSALALKLEREQALGARRSEYDDLTAKLRGSDERRMQLERELEPLRNRIGDFQLKEQAARLGAEQYAQFLSEAQADLVALAASIEEGKVRLSGLQGEIDRLNREIASLGAVNLAALDELSSARERKTFLDTQMADLTEAMNTLEDAIRRIDSETRVLLNDTFNAVNDHFGRMFPELFGGGHAKLVMTGEEILDSGVQVTAQPPGKKNQTIHLLSGGEKALTAIALVFAIFQLNPAPFCLLDEVDAPLDDANTERYAKLVSKMSSDTQFLFISHNKIAMEMAGQLIGVTMQEQGVSRIVAVDMDSAAAMVEVA